MDGEAGHRPPAGRAARDGRPPRVVPTREGYDLWAALYDDENNPLITLEETRFEELLSDVRGLTILDIGCGTGRHALAMARAGARVVGVDFSEGMLAKARAKAGSGCVWFVRHDLSEGLPFASGSFDRVTCSLVLEHVADLTGAFREMRRVCRPEGFVLVSDLHPAMRLLGVQAQFTDPASGCKVWPVSVPHRVSDYVMAAGAAGLRIDHMSEHAPDEALAAVSPRARPYLGWPMLLMLRMR